MALVESRMLLSFINGGSIACSSDTVTNAYPTTMMSNVQTCGWTHLYGDIATNANDTTRMSNIQTGVWTNGWTDWHGGTVRNATT